MAFELDEFVECGDGRGAIDRAVVAENFPVVDACAGGNADEVVCVVGGGGNRGGHRPVAEHVLVLLVGFVGAPITVDEIAAHDEVDIPVVDAAVEDDDVDIYNAGAVAAGCRTLGRADALDAPGGKLIRGRFLAIHQARQFEERQVEFDPVDVGIVLHSLEELPEEGQVNLGGEAVEDRVVLMTADEPVAADEPVTANHAVGFEDRLVHPDDEGDVDDGLFFLTGALEHLVEPVRVAELVDAGCFNRGFGGFCILFFGGEGAVCTTGEQHSTSQQEEVEECSKKLSGAWRPCHGITYADWLKKGRI